MGLFGRAVLFTGVAMMVFVAQASPQGPQAPSSSAGAREVFKSATVRPRIPVPGDDPEGSMRMGSGPGCGFNALQIDSKRFTINAFPYTLISLAYGWKDENCNVAYRIAGGPDWIKSERFDIETTLPEGTPTYTLGQVNRRDAPKLQRMLQTLLENRFKLKLHRETETTGFVLTVGPGGPKPKLTSAKETDLPVRRRNIPTDPNGKTYGELVLVKGTMAVLAQMLTQYVGNGQLVVDRTGLKGEFNLVVEYDSSGAIRPVMATALAEEAGLKLEPGKVPADVLVIDSMERPSGN